MRSLELWGHYVHPADFKVALQVQKKGRYAPEDSYIRDQDIRYDLSYEDSAIWQEVSENGKDLLRKLLEKDPYKRISADSALKHPWFEANKSKHRIKTSTFLKDLSQYYVLIAERSVKTI